MAVVLAQSFGDAVSFRTTSATRPGVVRSFSSFSKAAQENADSRIYIGFHFQARDHRGAQARRQNWDGCLQSLSAARQVASALAPARARDECSWPTERAPRGRRALSGVYCSWLWEGGRPTHVPENQAFLSVIGRINRRSQAREEHARASTAI